MSDRKNGVRFTPQYMTKLGEMSEEDLGKAYGEVILYSQGINMNRPGAKEDLERHLEFIERIARANGIELPERESFNKKNIEDKDNMQNLNEEIVVSNIRWAGDGERYVSYKIGGEIYNEVKLSGLNPELQATLISAYENSDAQKEIIARGVELEKLDAVARVRREKTVNGVTKVENFEVPERMRSGVTEGGISWSVGDAVEFVSEGVVSKEGDENWVGSSVREINPTKIPVTDERGIVKDWTPVKTRLEEIVRSARNYSSIVALTGDKRLEDRARNINFLIDDRQLLREMFNEFSNENDPKLNKAISDALVEVDDLLREQINLSKLDEYRPEHGSVQERLQAKLAQMEELRSERQPRPFTSSEQLVYDRIQEEKDFIVFLNQLKERGEIDVSHLQDITIEHIISDAELKIAELQAEVGKYEIVKEEGRRFEGVGVDASTVYETLAPKQDGSQRGNLARNVFRMLASSIRGNIRAKREAAREKIALVTPIIKNGVEKAKSAGNTFVTHKDWLGGLPIWKDMIADTVKKPFDRFHDYLDRAAEEHQKMLAENIAERNKISSIDYTDNVGTTEGKKTQTSNILNVKDAIHSVMLRLENGEINITSAEQRLVDYVTSFEVNNPDIDTSNIKMNIARMFEELREQRLNEQERIETESAISASTNADREAEVIAMERRKYASDALIKKLTSENLTFVKVSDLEDLIESGDAGYGEIPEHMLYSYNKEQYDRNVAENGFLGRIAYVTLEEATARLRKHVLGADARFEIQEAAE